jgi:hypothetical protein
VLERAQRVPGFLQHELELRHLFRHVIDDRLLLAERLEVDPHVVEDVNDRVRLGLDLVHELAVGVDGGDAFVGLDDLREQFLRAATSPRCSVTCSRSARLRALMW